MMSDSSLSSPVNNRYYRKKKENASYSYSDSEDIGQREQKRKAVKKRRLRLWRRNRSDSTENGTVSDTGGKESAYSQNSKQERNNYSRGARGMGDSNDNNGGYESDASSRYGGRNSSFQLDNVMSRSSQAPSGRNFLGGANHSNSTTPVTPTNRGSDVEDEDLNKKIRVKPHSAFPTATYMNETDLYQCMMAGSSKFEFLTSYLNPSTNTTRRIKVPDSVKSQFGSPKEDGRVGSLRVEILGCVGLDRVKPEVSVYAVCGDCAFSTDNIQGNRSPMWPNSSKRAAVFPLHHAYARLFIGVFDVNNQKEREADQLCGRVSIDIPSLRPDTEYDITFPLRASAFIYDRRPRGVVRVRFSMHWFSERSAIISYLKRPRNPLAFSKQGKKFPTIPCGDPKTFRNVAVTVHGQDFPGKYTRGAFKATMREFNLSQQNIRFLLKVLVLDCILYENPFMSVYLFVTSMYCVYQNSIRLAPPFFVGFLIYLLVENNMYFNGSEEGNLGYRALTIPEVFYGLVFDGKNPKRKFNSILVKKRPRRQVIGEDGKIIDIELQNHREFPFSERFAYPKFSAADAIASTPSTNKKKGKKKDRGSVPVDISKEIRTTRRLSIVHAPMVEQVDQAEESDEESEEDSQEGEDEDEEMLDDAESYGYENMDDSDEEDLEEEFPSKKNKRKGRILETGKASKHRRIRVGPPQNCDKSGNKKTPPQAHLSKVEHMLHRASKNISVEHVHFPPPQLSTQLGKEVNAKGPAGDVLTAKEKKHFDDFDKLLGYRLKNPNPIVRITSSFLGPLMRIIRIVIYAVRISFNVCSWRDPYLTFWVFAFLCTLAFVLLIFPWRTFFFLSSLVLLGPQNIGVRMYLERRAKRREQEEKEEKEKEALKAQLKMNDPLGPAAQAQLQQTNSSITNDKDEKKKRGWGRSRRKEDENDEKTEENNEADFFNSPRPAFYAHAKPSKRAQVPRDVAIPYFRFRKDRFYDWPPDPTVSRATPMMTESQTRFDEDGRGMRRRSGFGDVDGDYGFNSNTQGNSMHNSIRARPGRQVTNDRSGLRNRSRAASREEESQDGTDYGYG